MNLTAKQIEKRKSMIEDAIAFLMEGYSVQNAERKPITREEAIYKLESMLCDKGNLTVFNGLVAAFS